MRFIYLFLLLFSTASPAYTCSSGATAGVTVNWCLQEAVGFSATKVLYYLHAYNGDDTTFLASAEYTSLSTEWAAIPASQPAIITVSLGTQWTLTDLPSSYISGTPVLLSTFANSIIPYLETQTGLTPTHRWLYGESMGGYNAAQLLINYSSLFEKVVLGCAGLTTVTKFSSTAVRQAYASRTGTQDSDAIFITGLINGDSSIVADWNRNDPLQQIGKLPSGHPAIFIWWNRLDLYGVFEGNSQFANRAQMMGGGNITQMSVPGGHCVTNQTDAGKNNVIKNLAAFLSP